MTHRRRTTWRLAARWAASAVCALSVPALGQYLEKDVPAAARGLDITERPGAQVPPDFELLTSEGKTVRLGEYFDKGRPLVVALVYYDCPVACPAVMGALMKCLNGLDYQPGREFDVVVVSFDPTNTREMAIRARMQALAEYERPKTPEVVAGLKFHTARGEVSRALADAVGFGYRYLPEADEYSHAIGLFVLTPSGKVSRYFYGFEYAPRDMRLSLLEASEGKISRTIGDRLLLFCYHYDPKKGTYSLAAWRIMQGGAALTVLVLGATVGLLRLAEVRRRSRASGKSVLTWAAPGFAGPGVFER